MSALLETPTVDLARECLYRFFSIALSDPRGGGLSELQDPENRCMIAASADVLREEAEADPVPLGFGERPATDLDPTPTPASGTPMAARSMASAPRHHPA